MSERKLQEAPGDLEKRVGVFTDDAMPRIVEAGHKVRRKFDAVTRGPGDMRFPIERNKAYRETVRQVNGELAQMVFAVRGQAGMPLVREGASRIVANVVEFYASVALWPYGPADRTVIEAQRTKFIADLQRDVETLMDDFAKGQVWGQPLAAAAAQRTTAAGADEDGASFAADREPAVSVEEAMERLVKQIDSIVRTPAIVLLPDADRKGFSDILDDIRDEAGEREPDPLRLRRWTERFLSRLKTAGVTVPEEPVKASLAEALKALGAPAL